MKRTLPLFLLAFLFMTSSAVAQKWIPTKIKGQKQIVQKAAYHDVSLPLTEMKDPGWQHYQKGEENEVPNFFLYKLFEKTKNLPDKLSQSNLSVQTKATATVGVNVEGAANTDNSGMVAPPDVAGDVGENYYVEAVNNITLILDKSGSTVWGPQPTSVFWDGFDGPWSGTNDGDPVIMYDQNAKRWVITQFAVSTNDGTQWELIAVSTSSDPTGSYYRYAYQFDLMPDYPKLGVWPDAYYLSANAFGSSLEGTYAAALERDRMLVGDPNARIVVFFNDWGSTGTYSMLPSDADVFPANGTPNYFIYDTDDESYWSVDALKVWEFHVDWNNTSNSYFQIHASLIPESFSTSFNSDVPQPSHRQKLDLLNDRMMYRAQFRHFNDHDAIVCSRTVNDGGVAAIRWYELRNTGSGWSIYQQGTFNLGDGTWRWMPSIAMNGNGDIAVGYSVSSSKINPSIRITGRHAGDPLGVMTISETEIFAGPSSQVGVNRWGDYTTMTVDPVDDNTFWYGNEYSAGSWYWRTRIASFDLGNTTPPTCTAPAITANPQSQTVIEGDNVNFNVTATGTTLNYQWRKNGIDISGANAATYSLTSVTSTDEGQYDCVVSNDCGTETSTSATLTVEASNICVSITQQPTDLTVNMGKDATFTVTVIGTGLTYQWYKDGVLLDEDSHYVGTTSSSLTIVTTDKNIDLGDYFCIVSAACGYEQSSSAHLSLKYHGKVYSSMTTFEAATEVYPNPFTSTLKITLSSNDMPANVEIYDITGKAVFSTILTNQFNEINLESLIEGNYLVKISSSQGNQEFFIKKQ